MSRDLQLKLHGHLQTVTATLDLPLNPLDVERLAIELTPLVKALLAAADAKVAELVPVAYAVADTATTAHTETSEYAGFETTEYAGCLARIRTTVDLDSPAAVLAQWFRSRQSDVTATDVPSAVSVGVTVRPQSLHAWRWWLDKIGASPDHVAIQDDAAYVAGHCDGATVHIQGYGVPALLADKDAARLAGVMAGHPW